MLESPSVDIVHLFLFVIPGFIVVWSFRYFTNSNFKKHSDFEYFALSVFWGILLLFFNELLAKFFPAIKNSLNELLKNPYSGAFSFSIVGFMFGWLGSSLSKTKWLRKVIMWIKKYSL